VLPFLLGERIVGRIDLKADRAAGTLRVLAAHAEEDVDPTMTADALKLELRALAEWLGLERVDLRGTRGSLASALDASPASLARVQRAKRLVDLPDHPPQAVPRDAE
jgi:hypothetical protein